MSLTIEDRINRLSQEERELAFYKMNQYLAEKTKHSVSQGVQQLVAYVTVNENFDIDSLKRSLKAKVPEYMIPSRIIEVEKFPLLPNGKVDKKLLVTFGKTTNEKVVKTVERPLNETERKLLEIWKEVLNHTEIGIYDNFFEIGGDSILSIQVIAKAKSLNIPLSPNQLFECQTIFELSRFLNEQQREDNSVKLTGTFNHLVPIRPDGNKPPLFCLHSGGSHFFFYNQLANYLEKDRPLFALQASGHEGEVILHQTVQEMARDFVADIRRVYPKGPYHFVSYCFNTAIGVEITNLLSADSERANLIVADTMADYLSLFEPSKTTKRAVALLGRLKKSPLKTIRSFIIRKVIKPMRAKINNIPQSASEKTIQKLHNNHINIYRNYNWKPFQRRVQLLLTEKRDAQFNAKIIESWEKLATQGVDLINTQGHHNKLFEAPLVESTAKSITLGMQNFENNG